MGGYGGNATSRFGTWTGAEAPHWQNEPEIKSPEFELSRSAGRSLIRRQRASDACDVCAPTMACSRTNRSSQLMAKGTDRRSPPRYSVDPVLQVDIGPPPAFLLRKPPTAEESTTKARRSWNATAPMVLVALGVAALLVVAVTNGYWLNLPEREHVVAEVAALKTAPTGALPAPEMAPTRSAPQLTVGLRSPDNQPPPDKSITPLVLLSHKVAVCSDVLA
jgi:hypothetical protein